MKRKTAIKQLMSIGASRNYAKYYLDMMHIWTNMSNCGAVYFYKIYGNKWSFAFDSIAAEASKNNER